MPDLYWPILLLAYVMLGCISATALVSTYVGIRGLLWPVDEDEDDDLEMCAGDCACRGLACECYCSWCRAHYGEEPVR